MSIRFGEKIKLFFTQNGDKMSLSYSETTILEIHEPFFDDYGIRLLIKREDQNHPLISGNKWWKLKNNLAEATRQNKKTLLTFGGAYSNHLYATAAAAHELGFKSIGIVRGEEVLPLNNTLKFVREKGMLLYYVSREAYRLKSQADFIHQLKEQYGDFYLIPEGGTNELAVKGCAEFAETFSSQSFDYMCLPVGTGGTISGIITGLKGSKEIIGFPVVKSGEFLIDDVKALLLISSINATWKLITDYHFGGYAKTTPALIEFIRQFERDHSIPLDQVYTGKMMWGIFDLIKKNYFRQGSTILAIHTGGLQGRSF